MKRLDEYIKKENIKGYLSPKLDGEKLKEYVDNEEFEEEKKWSENVEDEEDYIYQQIDEYNYLKAFENEDINLLLEYIYGCEFDIEINKVGTLDLVDLQEVYLGGIDSYEGFEEITGIADRLSGSYFYDYYGISV